MLAGRQGNKKPSQQRRANELQPSLWQPPSPFKVIGDIPFSSEVLGLNGVGLSLRL